MLSIFRLPFLFFTFCLSAAASTKESYLLLCGLAFLADHPVFDVIKAIRRPIIGLTLITIDRSATNINVIRLIQCERWSICSPGSQKGFVLDLADGIIRPGSSSF